MELRDINLFRPGQTVTVPNAPDFKKTKILAINDSGVTVSSNGYSNTIISGKTPAHLYEDLIDTEKTKVQNSEIVKEEIEQKLNMKNDNTENNKRAKRGTYTAKMENLQFPTDSFTVGQLAELNEIPVNYANNYIKDAVKNGTMEEAGKVDKKPGQRGKVATLYKVKQS